MIDLSSVLALLALTAGTASETPANTLRWSARDEAGTFGYLIYRSDVVDGAFHRINPRIVRAHAESGEGYVFVDHDIKPGITYYYRIDGVNDKGIKKRLSPVMSKTARPDRRASPSE